MRIKVKITEAENGEWLLMYRQYKYWPFTQFTAAFAFPTQAECGAKMVELIKAAHANEAKA